MAPRPAPSGAVLALDTASPTVSVAVADPAAVRAERREEIARSSVRLLGMIDEALAEAGVGLGDLAGVVVLAGPGSFTGLRVGMATALGLHQAGGVPATAVPTLEVLALWAPAGRPAVAAVDVLRGEWVAQSFDPPRAPNDPPRPRGEARRVSAAELAARVRREDAVLVGFGARRLAAEVGDGAGERVVEPEALAPAAALAAARRPPGWDSGRLTAPLYFRPPATTPPGRPAAAIRAATAADAADLARLEAACFADPWSEDQIAAELAQPAALVLIALRPPDPGEAGEPGPPGAGRRPPAGYASFRRLAGEGELLRIAVAPEARRRGVAAALLGAGLARLAGGGAAVCHLEVDEENGPAIRLYEGAGFHRVGRRPGYYGQGRGALLYARALRAPAAAAGALGPDPPGRGPGTARVDPRKAGW